MTTRSTTVAPRATGIGAFFRKWTIPFLGAVTPVMLITINIAAFIFKHLNEFRIAVTVLAFVSSLLLNGWTAFNVWNVIRRRWPATWVAREENHQNVLLIGIFVVFVTAFLTALFCYLGLGDERSIPNAPTFLTGAISIAIPILLQAVFNRARGQGASAQRRGAPRGAATSIYQPGQPGPAAGYQPGPPGGWQPPPGYGPPPAPPNPGHPQPPGPPQAAPPGYPAHPPAGPLGGGYPPPGSLPPS